MKIVILTAGIGEKKTSIPRCFTTTIGSVALIEYLVRILRLLNIPPNDIYLATSSSIMWGSKKYHDTISSLGVNEIIIEKKFKHSFPTLLKSLKNFKSEDVLVVNGDNYFKFSDLEYLIYNNSNINKALIHKRNSVASKEPILDLIKNKILKIVTQNQSKKIPWYTYYGAIYLKKSDVIKIKKFKLFDVPYLECLVNKMKIKVETKEISSISDKNSEYKLKELKGGSFAGLKKMILVHKQADKIGRDKLINEIKWIQNLDQKASKKFPTIINYEISKNSAWYTMPWYPIDNLRQKIISGVFGINEISYNIKPVLNFLWENLYLKKKQKANLDWVNKKHFDRYYKRQNKLKKIQPFKKILELNKILINGHQYQNLPNIMNEVKNLSDKYKVFVPNSLFRIHGDLHFQNILVGFQLLLVKILTFLKT